MTSSSKPSSYDVIGDPAFFGTVRAEDYDGRTERDPTPAVDFLASLAGGRRTLELAIGTGRVALPPAARGVPVRGRFGLVHLVFNTIFNLVDVRRQADCFANVAGAGAGRRVRDRDLRAGPVAVPER